MQIKVFTIPALSPEEMEQEANKFLRSHRILQIDRQFSAEHGGYWSLFVTYMEGEVTTNLPTGRKEKVDYRQVLTEDEFARFAKYREIRKQLAQEENIPPFVIFTDEELATISKPEILTLAVIKELKGVGEKKAEKYGSHFIEK